jgi:catechol 2,3-dioxygenase-like lactoylglutathione lyase family enzyme
MHYRLSRHHITTPPHHHTNALEFPMSRFQLALDVSNIDDAVTFYSRLFGIQPAKRKPGYANFEIADPPLKLVLIEGVAGGTLNHLGVETDSSDEVVAAEARLSGNGLQTTGVDDTVCCYAEKTETWVTDPDGAKWEWYVKRDDADQMNNQVVAAADHASAPAPGGSCCSPSRP